MKLKADIYRYMTEFAIGIDFTHFKDEADTLYKKATLMLKYWRQKKMANNPDDDKIDTLRLSLQLNYAVFMYDIKNEKKQGLRNLKKPQRYPSVVYQRVCTLLPDHPRDGQANRCHGRTKT